MPGILEKDELEDAYSVDTPEEYIVSQASLDQLIAAYLSAPADHSQLVQINNLPRVIFVWHQCSLQDFCDGGGGGVHFGIH